MNPYEVLEVLPDAAQGALRDSYRRLVRLHHPDLASNQEQREQSHDQMQRINQAWQLIGDVEKRAEFDAKRAEAIRDEGLRREQVQKPHKADVKRAKSGTSKNPSKTSTSRAREASTSVSPTRHRLRKLKKVRSPEEIRVRNQQKLVEARQFWQEGQVAEAIASCQSVLRNDFRSVAAREILGDIYLSIGDKAKALVLFEQAFALQKGSSSLGQKIAEIRGLKLKEPVKEADGWEVQDVSNGGTSFWRRLRRKLGNRR